MIWVAKKQEPIQELLNQIESNEAKIQQYQERTTELFELNEQHKQKLLNEYWLELSKAFTKNVEQKEESQDDSEICPADLFEKYLKETVSFA